MSDYFISSYEDLKKFLEVLTEPKTKIVSQFKVGQLFYFV